MSSNVATNADFVTEQWTYIGRRLLQGGGLGYVWLDTEGTSRIFKKLKGTVVGGLFEVRCSPDRESVLPHVRYKGKTERKEVPGWKLEDDAAYTADQAEKSEKRAVRDSKESIGKLTLEEVRDRLWNAGGMHKAALMTRVLNYLK